MTDKANSLRISHPLSESLLSLYPELNNIDPAHWLRLINQAQPYSAPPHTMMQTQPGPYDHFFLLMEGSTRVFQTDENGRELTFFRNYPGDICPHNLHKLFHSTPGNGYVQAETAIHGLQISQRVFNQVLLESESFRTFIFRRLSRSFNDLTASLEESVFSKLDIRLCHLLHKLFTRCGQPTLKITHQQLANELGTTREVISRSLKELEQKGCLKITRGYLTLVAPEKLAG